MREWLPGQIQRRKWREGKSDVKVEDVVLVVDPETVRGKWPLGKITKTFPSPDGKIRKVQVMVNKILYVRPISRICVLNLE